MIKGPEGSNDQPDGSIVADLHNRDHLVQLIHQRELVIASAQAEIGIFRQLLEAIEGEENVKPQ